MTETERKLNEKIFYHKDITFTETSVCRLVRTVPTYKGALDIIRFHTYFRLSVNRLHTYVKG